MFKVDGNKNGLEIVLWIKSRKESQNVSSTVRSILSSTKNKYFTTAFKDGSMIQLRSASSCQDLKCEYKTKTVFTNTRTVTTTTTTATSTTTPTSTKHFNHLRSSSKTLLHDIVLIAWSFLVASIL